MFGLSTLYVKLISAGVIVAAALGLYLYVQHLKTEVRQLGEQVVLEQGKVVAAQQELVRATQAATELDLSLKAAEANRVSLVRTYDARLKALRGQKPPTECKDVIEWSIQNKGDLAW